MQSVTSAKKPKGRLASLFGRRSPAQKQPPDIRERLAALAGTDGIEILNALFKRLGRLEQGVNAERFRIDFKDRRRVIDKLRQWFIKESSDAKRTYQPTLIALPLIDDDRAKAMVTLIDRVLVYLAAELDKESGRKITLGEMVTAFGAREEDVADALGYLFDGPMSAGRSIGFPAGPEWYVIPNEQSLDYPNLEALLRQMTEWAERAANELRIVLRDGQPNVDAVPRKSWISRHKGLLIGSGALAGGALTVLANLATVIEFFQSVLGIR